MVNCSMVSTIVIQDVDPGWMKEPDSTYLHLRTGRLNEGQIEAFNILSRCEVILYVQGNVNRRWRQGSSTRKGD